MDYLTNRQIQILKFITEQKTSVSSEYLSKYIGISSKTIKKDIKVLSNIVSNNGAKIISKTGMGYLLIISDNKLYTDFYSSFGILNQVPKSSLPFYYQRSHYIIRRLLTSNTFIRIDDLADELFNSRTTISKDMKYVKEILNSYHITIINKPHYGLSYLGSEHDLRLCLVDEYEYFLNNDLYVNEGLYASLFKVDEETYKKIGEVCYNTQRTFGPLEISYQNLKIIILLIILCYHRRNFDIKSSYSDEQKYNIKMKSSYVIADYMLKLCAKILDYPFNNAENLILAIYLTCYRNFINVDSVTNKKRFHERHDTAEDVLNYICKNNQFNFLYTDSTLCNTLALHFLPMLNRIEYNIKLDSSYLLHIKQNSLTSTELAVLTAQYFKEMDNVTLSENEICFLGHCFYPVFGRYNLKTHKKNIILINSMDKGVGNNVAERLSRNFGAYINQIKLCDLYELQSLNFDYYDLIFTDIPTSYLPNVPLPIIQLNTFFKENEKSHIRNILTLAHNDFNIMLKNYNKNYFFNHISLKNKEEYFDFIYNKFSKLLNIPQEFYNDLFIRDSLCSIEVGSNTAVMKTLRSYVKESFISVSILEKPIIWRYKSVQIIVIWHIGIGDEANAEFMEDGYFGNILRSTFLKSNNSVKLLQNPEYETLITLLKERIIIIDTNS